MTESPTVRWMWWIARLEGVSFLLLMLVAMPLKRVAGIPEPNAWVGWAHGLLFLTFLVALDSARRVEQWPRSWLLWGFLGAVLPAGTFVFEARVRRRLHEGAAAG